MNVKHRSSVHNFHGTSAICAAAAVVATLAIAPSARAAGQVGDVFVIALENHNWTQPNGNVNPASGTIEQIKNNPNAPFINSLVNGTASATINGQTVNISSQTAYTNKYFNVLANSVSHIHPSEPNYIWSEAGTNFGVANDNTPYGVGGTNQNTNQHLTGLLSASGISWKSYQEDTDLVPTSGGVNTPSANTLTSTVAAQSAWTTPLTNFAGTNAAYTNPFNGSHQYDYAAKHNPALFFTDTNGGNDATNANARRLSYAPLQQLQTDLTNGTVARYNFITPDQFNDMHTALSGGYVPLTGGSVLTGDASNIRQGDDFLKQIVPQIMASQAYKNNGTIVIWNDETESQGGVDNADDLNHAIVEIVISPLAHPNVGGLPYASDSLAYSHSSDLRTWQELFGVSAATPSGFLGDAANANDLSDLFQPGAVPEPASLGTIGVIAAAALLRRRRA